MALQVQGPTDTEAGNALLGPGETGLNVKSDRNLFAAILVCLQVVFFVYLGANGLNYGDVDLSPRFYSMFVDVSIMIFFGFGFLMTFLRRHGYSAVGLCMIISAATIQMSLIMEKLLEKNLDGLGGFVNLEALINGLFCAGAVMISMGAVLGKVSPSQLLVMALCESVLFWVNFSVYTHTINAEDTAGGIVLHAFGAYFGLAVARFLTNERSLEHEDNSSIYSSDMFSLAGTLFLWILWPSFCGAVAPTTEESFYAVVNTFLALIGSAIAFAILSRFLHDGKFNIVEMQNATLAGGVAIGVPATAALGPLWATLLGLAGGLLSTFGYVKVDLGKIGISDTCGVHNLHGMPGLLSGIVGIYVFKDHAAEQALGMVCSLSIAIVGGVLTGLILKSCPGVGPGEMFNDSPYWEVTDDYKLKGK